MYQLRIFLQKYRGFLLASGMQGASSVGGREDMEGGRGKGTQLCLPGLQLGGESVSGRLQCIDTQGPGTLHVAQAGPDTIHEEAGSTSLHTPTLAPPQVPG